MCFQEKLGQDYRDLLEGIVTMVKGEEDSGIKYLQLNELDDFVVIPRSTITFDAVYTVTSWYSCESTL